MENKIETEKIDLDTLKVCVDWLYKNKNNEVYREGYMDALYDMAATLGMDEELSDYEDQIKLKDMDK